MLVSTLLHPTVALVVCFLAAGTPSPRLMPNAQFSAIPPHVRNLNTRDEPGGVYMCLYKDWGPPCVYHRPSFSPNYPICWTSIGLDMQHPFKPIGSIGPDEGTICYGFHSLNQNSAEQNVDCTRGIQNAGSLNYAPIVYPGFHSEDWGKLIYSVKCMYHDPKLIGYEALGPDFTQKAPRPKGQV